MPDGGEATTLMTLGNDPRTKLYLGTWIKLLQEGEELLGAQVGRTENAAQGSAVELPVKGTVTGLRSGATRRIWLPRCRRIRYPTLSSGRTQARSEMTGSGGIRR